jgi:hemolysin activation/secretion protein
VDSLNTNQAFADFTNGRMQRASYLYAQASFVHQARLTWDLSLNTQIAGQYAGRSIPDSQQIALGGQSSVRGYSFDDGAWDDGIVVRNDLRAKEFRLGSNGRFTPRAFIDYGWGQSDAAHVNVQQVSGGVGGEIRMGNGALASLDVAIPLTSGRETRVGVARFDVRVSLAY